MTVRRWGEEPRCALCKFDIIDGCCDDGACEGDFIAFVLTVRKLKYIYIFSFFFLNAETLRFGF